MDKKKLKILLCVVALSALYLSGCAKDKVTKNTEYQTSDITALEIKVDTWKLDIVASSEKAIRIDFDGSTSTKDTEPMTLLKNNILTVQQESSDDGLQEQIALGKKGQITVYIPSDCIIPININNGSGDIEADGVSTTNFQLINNSGYVTLSHLTADSFEISSTSGDITVKNSDVIDNTIFTSSGYVQLNGTTFDKTEIVTKSGEINISEVSPETNISLQTGSGDINLNYRIVPDNIDFEIASGSKDISARLKGAIFSKETTECKQGIIGDGQYKLVVNSVNGTVVIK